MQKISLFTKIVHFLFLLVLVNAIGYVASSYMTEDTRIWYKALSHSSLNPPDYVFSVVWSVLLFLQAVAATIVWGKASPRYFVLQLALNMLWSFIFFYLRRPDFALIVVICFAWALMMNIKSFAVASKWAGWMIVPTLIWSFFALYLNSVIVF